MNFHETKMGHQFYMSDFPRMVKTLEKLGEAMEKQILATQAGKSTNSIFNWVADPTEELLREAKAYAATTKDTGLLASIIMSEIKDNTDGKTARLVFDYAHATQEERRAIDGFFVDLTGWTFATLLRRYIACRSENAWKANEGYIIIQASDEGGWDYTLYTPEYELIDGGQVDEPAITAEELKDQLVKDFGWDAANIIPADYAEVEEAVTAVEEKKWME